MSETGEIELNLAYLKARLACLDVSLRQEVRRWQLAGRDPGDAFRGLYISDDEASHLAARPALSQASQGFELTEQEQLAYASARRKAEATTEQIRSKASQQGWELRLDRLMSSFELDAFDRDILLICLAPEIDRRYERVYSYLQDDVTRKRPTLELALDLSCPPQADRLLYLAHFSDQAPLLRYEIIEKMPDPAGNKPTLLSQAYGIQESIYTWLLGRYQAHASLAKSASLISGQPKADDWLLGEKAPAWPAEVNTIYAFYGPDTAGQMAAARVLAASSKMPLLAVDLAQAAAEGLSPRRAVWLALRDARLTGALPLLFNWEACLAQEGDFIPVAGILDDLCNFPGAVLTGSHYAWRAPGLKAARRLAWTEFPVPGAGRSTALWAHYLDSLGGPETSDRLGQVEITTLSGQFRLSPAQIRDAVATARDLAFQQGQPLHIGHLFAAARSSSTPNLSSLARKITPRYGWHDIILPADQISQLEEIVATMRGRAIVMDDWGVGRKLAPSQGITILFAGPPGTGKTMAAEIIAGELGLELYKIDLSTVVSKYIGETEKNLEKIFTEASSSNAILFFDEADAIFGKRSEVKDAHDRYANIEISYLLQRMESYNGVTILATNLRANLDEAFTRRLQFAIDFPFPSEADRRRIWESLFPPELPRDAALDFAPLARRFKISGGNIRNIIISAAYMASTNGGKVTMQHLLHGARREMQKMGRMVEEEMFAEKDEGR